MTFPCSMLVDARPITSIVWADGNAIIKAGTDGVTKIVAYTECGQMAHVPWLAVYKGDEVYCRLDATGKEIYYS